MAHNATDVENSRKAAFNFDFRTKRKKSRVQYFLLISLDYNVLFSNELGWSEFETYVINNVEIAYLNQEAAKGEKLNGKKLSSRELRLQLVRSWGKRCMRHYYAKKRIRDPNDHQKRKRMGPTLYTVV